MPAGFPFTLPGSDVASGIFQVRQLGQGFETAEWGFAIGSPFWGTGVFADAAALVLDFVFDVGRLIENEKGPDHREVLLRQELRRNPNDALAAANLAFLLIQKDDLAEAEKWLRHALRTEYSLPDSGRRVRMQLREIERRRLSFGEPVRGTTHSIAKPPNNDHGYGI